MSVNKTIINTIWALFVILALGIIITDGIVHFRNSRCQGTFGAEFNEKRKALHVPVLPNNWTIYEKDVHYTAWQAPTVKKGHGFKAIVYNGCELDGEEDHYYFSSKKLQDTVLQVEHRYKNSHRPADSTIFIFQRANHADSISSKQADSIFKRYEIDMDY